MSSQNSNKEVAKMNHKQEVRLNRLQFKLEIEQKIVQTMLNECGDWHDGTGKDKLVLRVFEGERLEASIFKSNKCSTYIATVPDWKMKMEIKDREVVDLIDEGVEKAQKEAEKKRLKEDKKLQANSDVSFMDVYNRIVKGIQANTNYKFSDVKDENSPVIMKFGKHALYWNSVKEFLTAQWDDKHSGWSVDKPNCVNIFKVLKYWSGKYYKLVYPSLRTMVDKIGVLGKMPETAVLPITIMRELDKLKIPR